MLKTIPQLQIEKHLGNSHFCEYRVKNLANQINNTTTTRVTRQESKILPETPFVKYSTSPRKKIKKSKSRVEQPANVVLPNKKTFTEFVLSNVETM